MSKIIFILTFFGSVYSFAAYFRRDQKSLKRNIISFVLFSYSFNNLKEYIYNDDSLN